MINNRSEFVRMMHQQFLVKTKKSETNGDIDNAPEFTKEAYLDLISNFELF